MFKTLCRKGAFFFNLFPAMPQEKFSISSFVGVLKQEGDFAKQSVLASLLITLHICSSIPSLSFGEDSIAATMDLISLPLASTFPNLVSSSGSSFDFFPLE